MLAEARHEALRAGNVRRVTSLSGHSPSPCLYTLCTPLVNAHNRDSSPFLTITLLNARILLKDGPAELSALDSSENLATQK
jgi:hypothetical protein